MSIVDTQTRPEPFTWEDSAPEPARPSLMRLIGLEIRKMVDTRAGFWLLMMMALGALAFVAVQLRWGAAEDATFSVFFEGLLFPVALLLPVLGILTVTGEWSHRTALSTFTLVPQRLRVVTAKLGAAIVLAVASTLVTLLASALGNLLALAFDKGEGSWKISVFMVLHTMLWHVLSVVMGVAFGMLLANAALAISVFFALPLAWNIVLNLADRLKDAAPWVNIDTAMEALLTHSRSVTTWAQLGTSALLWIGVPLLFGSISLLRREIK